LPLGHVPLLFAALFRIPTTRNRKSGSCLPPVGKHEILQDGPELQLPTSPEAIVWRHWYSTVNGLLGELPEKTRRDVSVVLLPKGAVAGEWFVSIPKYSAAAEKGLEHKRMLTSREEELDRMVRGVGLPTRSDFYYGKTKKVDSVISPFFRLRKAEVADRLRTAFRRSNFACYSVLSPVLATSLEANSRGRGCK
jgi:hypothetical protein